VGQQPADRLMISVIAGLDAWLDYGFRLFCGESKNEKARTRKSGLCNVQDGQISTPLILANQGVDQSLAVWAAPSGDQIVAHHGRVTSGFAAGNVMKIRIVV
jgi:hypothetical protein